MTARLQERYDQELAKQLAEKFSIRNRMAIPKLKKIVISMGIGDGHADKARLETAANQLGQIAGQKPIVTKARKSISNFKLREGMPVGVMVTLRGRQMWEFLYRLIAVALPGIRDFRGVKDRLDGNGNYTLGITDHSIFPEAHGDHSKYTLGMDICISTTASSDDEGRELLKLLGVPFRKRNQSTANA